MHRDCERKREKSKGQHSFDIGRVRRSPSRLTEHIDARRVSQVASERLTHEEVTSAKRDASSTMEVEDDIAVPFLWLGGLRRGELITVHEPEAAGPDFGK